MAETNFEVAGTALNSKMPIVANGAATSDSYGLLNTGIPRAGKDIIQVYTNNGAGTYWVSSNANIEIWAHNATGDGLANQLLVWTVIYINK